MADPPADCALHVAPHAILLASGARLSFQRYAAAAAPVFARPPASLGALPCAASGDGAIVPLAEGEGMWIGCLPAAGAERSVLTLQAGAPPSVTATAERGAALLPIAGLAAPGGGFAAITRDAPCVRLRLSLQTRLADAREIEEAIAINLVTPAAFEAATGRRVPPLDPAAGFAGVLLP